jgi:selenocysteine lyase/cysteine desulfurase
MIRRSESNFEDTDTSETQGLLVFTAQSNVTGIKQDIGLLHKAQQMGFDTVIDVAALASTSRVSLNNINADAAIVSFYKLFGRLWSLKVLSLTGSSCS